MKKTIGLLLCLTLLFISSASIAFATEGDEPNPFEGWSSDDMYRYGVETMGEPHDDDLYEYAITALWSPFPDWYHADCCNGEDPECEEFLTRASYPCDKCNGGVISDTVTYYAWGNTGNSQVCAKDYRYVDLEQSRLAVYEFRCNKCSYTFWSSQYQYRWVCPLA